MPITCARVSSTVHAGDRSFAATGLRREELWNGNRERVGGLLSWDPQQSVIRWSWTQHQKYQERYGAAMTSPDLAHVNFVRLGSHAEAETWLANLRLNHDD